MKRRRQAKVQDNLAPEPITEPRPQAPPLPDSHSPASKGSALTPSPSGALWHSQSHVAMRGQGQTSLARFLTQTVFAPKSRWSNSNQFLKRAVQLGGIAKPYSKRYVRN